MSRGYHQLVTAAVDTVQRVNNLVKGVGLVGKDLLNPITGNRNIANDKPGIQESKNLGLVIHQEHNTVRGNRDIFIGLPKELDILVSHRGGITSDRGQFVITEDVVMVGGVAHDQGRTKVPRRLLNGGDDRIFREMVF